MQTTTTRKTKMTAPKILNAFWQQTMLRIKNPKVTVPFYQNNFGMTLVDEIHFNDMNFSLYFMATLPEEEVAKVKGFKPGSKVFFFLLFFLFSSSFFFPLPHHLLFFLFLFPSLPPSIFLSSFFFSNQKLPSSLPLSFLTGSPRLPLEHETHHPRIHP